MAAAYDYGLEAQAWLERRLSGLTPASFEGGVQVYCTADLDPGPSFQSSWLNVSTQNGWDSQQMLLTHEQATDLSAVLLFCDQTRDDQIATLRAIVANIDRHGHDAPPMVWVPHSLSPDLRPDSYSDCVRTDLALDMLQRGLDGIISGEPEGFHLALAVRSRLHCCDSLSQSLSTMLTDTQGRLDHMAQVKGAMEDFLWDYVRTRVAYNIPPVCDALPPGERTELPGYRFGNKLGEGKFGVVYRLNEYPDKGNPSQVAKVVAKEAITSVQEVRHFHRTIAVMTKLSDQKWWHPNILCLYEVYHTPTHLIFRQEYGGPESLFRRLSARAPSENQPARPLADDRVIAIICQCINAVAHMHVKASICHRDIKPENIMVNEQPESIVVKVSDFSLSAILTENNHTCRSACGTLPFAAPEVLLASAYDGMMADVWSLGVLLLEVLCGIRCVERVVAEAEPQAVNPSLTCPSTRSAAQMRALFEVTGACEGMVERGCLDELRSLLPVCLPVMSRMLEVEPEQRIPAQEVQQLIMQAFQMAVAPVAPPMAPGPRRPNPRRR